MCAINNCLGNYRQSGETEEGMMFKSVNTNLKTFVKRQIRVVETLDDYDDLKHISCLILDKSFFFSELRNVRTTMRSLVYPRNLQTVISGKLIRSWPFSFIQTKTNVLGLRKHLKVCDFWASLPMLFNNRFRL